MDNTYNLFYESTNDMLYCYFKIPCLNVMIYAKFYFIINYLYLCYYEPINFLCEKSVFSKLFNAYNCI